MELSSLGKNIDNVLHNIVYLPSMFVPLPMWCSSTSVAHGIGKKREPGEEPSSPLFTTVEVG